MAANWIVQNCLDPTDTKIVNDKKNILQIGSVLPAGTPGPSGEITGCYSAVEETVQGQNYQIFGDSLDCVDCLVSNGFSLIFRDCTTLSDYYISPESFSGMELPTVGIIYEASIGGQISFMGCFEFIGVTADLFPQSPIMIMNQYQTCSECQGGFSVSFEQEILINTKYDLNNIDILSKSGDFLEPFTYYISDQNNVKNVTISKETILIVGDSIGTLGIMVVDSNNFSATTTTEVLKRVSFNTNKGEILNNKNFTDFKKGVQDNYNLLIQNRINPQSQDQTK